VSIEGQAKGVLDNSTTQAKDLANDTMKEGRKVFARAADQVVPAVKQTLADVEESASDFFASTTDQIKKHPIQSLLIGFGVGALLGVALRAARRSA